MPEGKHLYRVDVNYTTYAVAGDAVEAMEIAAAHAGQDVATTVELQIRSSNVEIWGGVTAGRQRGPLAFIPPALRDLVPWGADEGDTVQRLAEVDKP